MFNLAADGTFRSCPGNFYQIYTILGIFEGKFLPLAFFVMKKKYVIENEMTFSYLKNNIETNTNRIIIDFEESALIAFSKLFPYTRISGFFFIFHKAFTDLFKKWVSNEYKSNSD
ncbi:hypothetical protein DMUE_4728 [Dictyocoela muelleri]|nr:hypothetical protein DMUE_4728 [Dictyocoela muelleri]